MQQAGRVARGTPLRAAELGPDDLEMTGNLFDHDFTIKRGDQAVATVSKRWLSVRETYAVDVAPGQDDLLILASVLALDLAQDQEREHR
jgi:uncharacterized protein YxjI